VADIAHLEDLALEGPEGVQRALQFSDSILKVFSRQDVGTVNISIKWDGSVSVVLGKDPETGKSFVSTKHGAFGKTKKLVYEKADAYRHFGDKPNLAGILAYIIDNLHMPPQGVWQGDVLYDRIEDHQSVVSYFKPNTILYKRLQPVPLVGPKLGIVWHTEYVGWSLDHMHGRPISDNHPPVILHSWCEQARYPIEKIPEGARPIAFDRTYFDYLSGLVDFDEKMPVMFEAMRKDGPFSKGELFGRFVNSLIRSNTTFAMQRLLDDAQPFILKSLEEKRASMKSQAGAERYEVLIQETKTFFETYRDQYDYFCYVYSLLWYLKRHTVNFLDKFAGQVQCYLGDKLVGHEGYVVYHPDLGAVKLVHRDVFSAANFQNNDA
jgi:hypothetical protein